MRTFKVTETIGKTVLYFRTQTEAQDHMEIVCDAFPMLRFRFEIEKISFAKKRDFLTRKNVYFRRYTRFIGRFCYDTEQYIKRTAITH